MVWGAGVIAMRGGEGLGFRLLGLERPPQQHEVCGKLMLSLLTSWLRDRTERHFRSTWLRALSKFRLRWQLKLPSITDPLAQAKKGMEIHKLEEQTKAVRQVIIESRSNSARSSTASSSAAAVVCPGHPNLFGVHRVQGFWFRV